MDIPKGLFKEYDVRGVYPVELNEKIAYYIAIKIGRKIGRRALFLGYDNREGSIKIKDGVIKGLRMVGVDVIETGLGPIMLPLFLSYKQRSYGICVTASHNPAEYTGILTYNEGVTVKPSDIIDDMKPRILSSKRKGKLIKRDCSEDYLRYISRNIGKIPLKIGVDSMGGTTGSLAKRLFNKVGSSVEMLYDKPSRTFYGKVPEPTKKNIVDLSKLVKRRRLDLGIELDADGDRVAFVDEKGRFVDPMTIAMIMIKYLGYKRIIATVSCSRRLEAYADVKYVKVGRPFIEKKLVGGDYKFGVETSSHFYFGGYYPFSDGLLGGLLLTSIMAENGKSLSGLVAEFPPIHYKNRKIRFSTEAERYKKLLEIREKAAKYGRVNRLDGVKVLMGGGFMLFRESNTEPLIRVYYEGTTKKELKRIERAVEKIVG